MNQREQLLARVREALRFPANKPGHNHSELDQKPGLPPTAHAREWLPKIEHGREGIFQSFCRMAADLKAEVMVVPDRAAMMSGIRAMSHSECWSTYATHEGELTTGALLPELGIPSLLVDQGYDPLALEKCHAGLTECDALVAQTGSVLITARSAGGRALSVLPPHHIVLARRSQLVPDLPEAFALLRKKYAGKQPSFISFITGPSRTGDIERILVLGAHGPKRLTIVVLDSE